MDGPSPYLSQFPPAPRVFTCGLYDFFKIAQIVCVSNGDFVQILQNIFVENSENLSQYSLEMTEGN